jgi:hypothetical protein
VHELLIKQHTLFFLSTCRPSALETLPCTDECESKHTDDTTNNNDSKDGSTGDLREQQQQQQRQQQQQQKRKKGSKRAAVARGAGAALNGIKSIVSNRTVLPTLCLCNM